LVVAGVSDTARERAERLEHELLDAAECFCTDVQRCLAHQALDLVLALLAEREVLRTELHFSETMHQADLDERVKIEKDCRALRERVAAAEKEITKVHNDLGAESMRCEKAEARVAAAERQMAQNALEDGEDLARSEVSRVAAEAQVAAITAILNDWVKTGNHTQEWQFYIGQLYDALAGVPVAEEAEKK
jgi:valyl-tRNA synthetase